MVAGGYFGRALVVDAGTAAASVLPLSDDLLRAYIGGAGLGAWLTHALGPPGVDPLAPEAPLTFVIEGAQKTFDELPAIAQKENCKNRDQHDPDHIL